MNDWTKEHQNTEETKWEVTHKIKAEGLGLGRFASTVQLQKGS